MMTIDVSYTDVKKSAMADRENMGGYEVTPPEQYLTGKKRYLKPKACYEEAFQYLADRPESDDIVLVHGLYHPALMNEISRHAWVEIEGNIIFDGVLQRFYDKRQYYEYYQIVEHKRYSRKEMHRIGLEHGGHYGPWNE